MTTPPDAAARQEALRALDPLEKVILEEPPAGSYPGGAPAGTSGAVEAIDYTANEVFVTLTAERPALLVLGGYLCYAWWDAVRAVLLAVVALLAMLVGLILLIFGLSELAGARQDKAALNAPAPGDGTSPS